MCDFHHDSGDDLIATNNMQQSKDVFFDDIIQIRNFVLAKEYVH